jgi:hypothetical protein
MMVNFFTSSAAVNHAFHPNLHIRYIYITSILLLFRRHFKPSIMIIGPFVNAPNGWFPYRLSAAMGGSLLCLGSMPVRLRLQKALAAVPNVSHDTASNART